MIRFLSRHANQALEVSILNRGIGCGIGGMGSFYISIIPKSIFVISLKPVTLLTFSEFISVFIGVL